jgi:hypothetical protein
MPVPRYYFHVSYPEDAHWVDAEGVELTDEDAAWQEATIACGQMIRDMDGALQQNTQWRMHVTDAGGATLFRLHFLVEGLGTTRPASPAGRRRLQRKPPGDVQS